MIIVQSCDAFEAENTPTEHEPAPM